MQQWLEQYDVLFSGTRLTNVYRSTMHPGNLLKMCVYATDSLFKQDWHMSLQRPALPIRLAENPIKTVLRDSGAQSTPSHLQPSHIHCLCTFQQGHSGALAS